MNEKKKEEQPDDIRHNGRKEDAGLKTREQNEEINTAEYRREQDKIR